VTRDVAIPARAHAGLPDPPGQGRFSRAVSRAVGAVPPPGLLLLSILSIQVGAALAVHLFAALGPIGTVALRVGFSALLLLAASRPTAASKARAHAGWVLLFGLVIAGMNLCFYEAIARIPLGIAVTIEFIGPLGIAVATSRRPLDFLWITMAIVGIGMLSPEIGAGLDPIGVLLAALAGAGWAGFVLVSRRVGRIFTGVTGLALGMTVAALLLLPVGVASGELAHVDAKLLLAAFAIALLSQAIPLSLEFVALKRLSPRAYGVLVTLEPAVAVMVGAIVLGQPVGPRTLLAVLCVTAAAVGITIFDRRGAGS
jgi:inner membrane transporter RhtA